MIPGPTHFRPVGIPRVIGAPRTGGMVLAITFGRFSTKKGRG
jgi:hypothetical protein